MTTQSDFLNEFNKMKDAGAFHDFSSLFSGDNLNPEALNEHIFGSHTKQGSFNTYDPFKNKTNVADFIKKVKDLTADDTSPVATDKKTRIKQINDELDIIRGRVKTPQGYIVNTLRAKSLMKELNQL